MPALNDVSSVDGAVTTAAADSTARPPYPERPKVSLKVAGTIADLIDCYGEAQFDCGEWRPDDNEPFGEVFMRAQRARLDLIEVIVAATGQDGAERTDPCTHEEAVQLATADGYRVERGAVDDGELRDRWWWTLQRPHCDVETSPEDWATATSAERDMVRAYFADDRANGFEQAPAAASAKEQP